MAEKPPQTDKNLQILYQNRRKTRQSVRGQAVKLCILEVRDSLSHAGNAGDDVAMGDHDTLRNARGAAGVHDDGDVRGLGLSALHCNCGAKERC